MANKEKNEKRCPTRQCSGRLTAAADFGVGWTPQNCAGEKMNQIQVKMR